MAEPVWTAPGGYVRSKHIYRSARLQSTQVQFTSKIHNRKCQHWINQLQNVGQSQKATTPLLYGEIAFDIDLYTAILNPHIGSQKSIT